MTCLKTVTVGLLLGILSVYGYPQAIDSAGYAEMLEKMAEVTEEEPDYQLVSEGYGHDEFGKFGISFSPDDEDREPPVTLKGLVHSGRHELLVRWGERFSDAEGQDYEGSMSKVLFRYTYSFHNRIKASITGEKDAGEQVFGPSQKYGMDYYAGYFSLANTGFVKALIIGNFSASFGQGLISGTGSRLGSVISFTPPLRVSQGLRGSSSAYEGSYLRGIAASLKFRRVVVSAFFSRHKRDASVSACDSAGGVVTAVTGFQTSGYHRNTFEIENRNTIRETVAGGNVSFTGSFFRIGATALHASWNASILPELKPYNLWVLRGRDLTAAGMDFIVRLRFITLFAEGGTTLNGAWAWVAGLIAEASQDVNFSVTARKYDPAYVNLFSNGISRLSRNANEEGCLANITARLFPSFTMSAYADLFRHPWLRYRVNNPSAGVEAGILCTFTGIRGVVFTGRLLYKDDERNTVFAPGGIQVPGRFSTLSGRIRSDWQAGSGLSLRTQVEFKGGLKGFEGAATAILAGQEGRAEVFKKRLGISFSYVLFDIPAWDLRIYSYESDVTGSFSVPAYNGKGLRAMLMLNGRIARHVQWWLRCGVLWKGSGTAEPDARVQVVVRW